MMTRSVAVVSAVAPYPADAGKKVVLAGLLDYLVESVGADSVHYVLVARPDSAVEMPVAVHHLDRPTVREQVASLAWRTVATRRHTIQESMLHAPRVRAELRATLEDIGADVEIFDTVRMAQYAAEIEPRPGSTRIVYLDDLFSVRYARMLELLRTQPHLAIDPLGEFRSVVPGALAKLVDSRTVQRLLLDYERRRMVRRETQAAREFATSLLVSPAEVPVLAERAGVTTVDTMPPLVDVAPIRRGYQGRPVFVLLGLLSLPHNHDAAMSFLTTCMPDLVRTLPDAQVQIVGRGARPELVEAAARFPHHVSLEGFVPDLDALLSQAAALLAPLRFGSGIKIKVLEALARGLPVLSTPVGAEGIRPGPEGGVVVEPHLERFPERMVELTDLAHNETLSANARRHHASTYSRAAVFGQYDRLFGFDAGSPADRGTPAVQLSAVGIPGRGAP